MKSDQRRAIVYGLVVVAGFVAIDIALSNSRLSSAYVLGAIIAGVLGGFRPALAVSVVAFVLAAISPLWNADLGAEGYFARLFVALCSTLLALGAGRLRDEVVNQLGRQQMLSEVADLPAADATLEQTVARVLEMLVPRWTAFAGIEADVGGKRVRIGSRGTAPADESQATVTPLRSRGVVIGTLTTAGGRGGADDPQFLRVFSGRVALALDNAGLSLELVAVEQRLQAILENLAEAVTVQDRAERVVYANRAAAELMGLASVDELLETPLEQIRARYRYSNEDGTPLEMERLPVRRLLAGEQPEPLVLRAIDVETGHERWQQTKSTAIRDATGNVALVVHAIEDITETKRSELSQRLLADVSSALASSLDYPRTVQAVADLVVPRFADWCSVVIAAEPAGQVALACSDPALADYAGSAALNAEVAASGEPRGEDDAERSVLVVPMATPERLVGVLALACAESRRRFGDADRELARELGRRIATAIENARLHSQLERVATTLQRSLLPPELPEVPGWSFRALYLPAGGETEVGGDFYDVFPTDAGWMAVMGDVVGRGPAAASLTAMGRYTLRTAGSLAGTPTTGLARLNDNLRARGDMALCTAAVVLLSTNDEEGSVVCAGHPLPYLIRAGDVRAVGRIGPLLGAFDHGDWLSAPLGLEAGDVLVLYTDGVLDARGREDRFGEARLEAALAGVASADEAVERIRSGLREFAGGEQDDDTAVLAMQKL